MKCPLYVLNNCYKSPNGHGSYKCPKNTDKYCNLKPKPKKLVRVKAWAVIKGMQIDKRHDKWINVVDVASPEKSIQYVTVPCTILIDKKYLKEK